MTIKRAVVDVVVFAGAVNAVWWITETTSAWRMAASGAVIAALCVWEYYWAIKRNTPNIERLNAEMREMAQRMDEAVASARRS